MPVSRRENADLDLVRLINAALPSYHLALTRIKRGGFPSSDDLELLEEAQRLLEEAVGRLMLRAPEATP